MTMDVQGRVALVTGAGQGIGLGIARALARAGARVALTDVDEHALAAAEAELAATTDVVAFPLDVRDRAAFAELADRVEADLGPVSLLFNNAGVVGAATARTMTYADWDFVLGVNLHGVVNGVQTFVPRMLERGGGGHIVNTASGAGLVGLGTNFLYVTAKFAVVGMSEALFVELAGDGIGVSVLCPGPVDTAIIDNSDRLKPDTAASRPAGALDSSRASLRAGVAPDAVGDMVLAAVAAGRLYVYTDTVMEEPIKLRAQMLLDALPKVTP